MRKNYFQYLVDEIKISERTILITQGAWAIEDKPSFARVFSVISKMLNAYVTLIYFVRTYQSFFLSWIF